MSTTALVTLKVAWGNYSMQGRKQESKRQLEIGVREREGEGRGRGEGELVSQLLQLLKPYQLGVDKVNFD